MHSTQTNANYNLTKHIALTLACTLFLIVVGACDDDNPPGTSPFGSVDAVIFGTVETEDATSVEGAVVHVRLYRDSLDASPSRFRPVRSETTGLFTRRVAFPADPSIVGLDLEVEAPPGSGLADTTFTVEPVELEFRTDPPFDSLRVDVVLTPEPSDDE